MRSFTALAATIGVIALTCPSIAFAQHGQRHREGVVALFNPDDFVPLDALTGDQFAEMLVEISSGALIGAVKMVDLAPDGSAARVLVELDGGGTIWTVADALRYNRYKRVLLTNLKNIELPAPRQAS